MSTREDDGIELDSVLEKLDGLNAEYEKSNPGSLTAVRFGGITSQILGDRLELGDAG